MASYTIEDIEVLRRKGGMSYREAVALLDYHNGNLAQALIDLEKSGRLKEEMKMEGINSSRINKAGGKHIEAKEKALNILQKLYRSRIKVHKGNTAILNFSVLFGGLCLLFAPHITIIGFVLSLILGYQFTFTKFDEDFAADNLEKIVKNAAQNAKTTVTNAVQSLKGEQKTNASQKTERTEASVKNATEIKKETAADSDEDPMVDLKKKTSEMEKTMDSFFETNQAGTGYHNAYTKAASDVPTIQIPIQAEANEGKVYIEDDQDGYSTVTVG